MKLEKKKHCQTNHTGVHFCIFSIIPLHPTLSYNGSPKFQTMLTGTYASLIKLILLSQIYYFHFVKLNTFFKILFYLHVFHAALSEQSSSQ